MLTIGWTLVNNRGSTQFVFMMQKSILAFICSVIALMLSACNEQDTGEHLQENQIVCTLKGDAFIYTNAYNAAQHAARSVESDALCSALNPRPESPASH